MSDNIEQIAESVISYLEFVKKFKKVKKEDIVSNEKEDENVNINKLSYIFHNFDVECYIIDKKSFDIFRNAINFDNLISILNPINDENKNKFKKELKKYLENNPYIPNGNNIKIYSKEEEMKEIVKNFNNYSFVNKELLIDGMGLKESQLDKKMLKSSKNKNNLYLLSVFNNFIVNININNKEKKNRNEDMVEEYKNLYYVEEITKKIFVLLYYNEKIIQEKIKKEIKDVYDFKKYYLINRDWLEEYKEFFLYDFIKKKLDNHINNNNYTYKKIKNDLNDIVKNDIGQIRLFSETQISDFIRNASNLEYLNEDIKINIDNINYEFEKETARGPDENIVSYNIPLNFEIVNEDIYKLLIKEEFFYNMNDNIEESLAYKILLGDNQIIIKNKVNKKNKDKNLILNNYLIYIYNNDFELEQNEQNNEKNNKQQDRYILKYILNYDKDNSFFNDFQEILKNGLNKFIKDKDIDINKKYYEKRIIDDNKNIIGKFININLNEKDIKNIVNLNNNENQKINGNDNIKINDNINGNNYMNNNDEKGEKFDSEFIKEKNKKSLNNEINENNNLININESNNIFKYDINSLKRRINIIVPFMKEFYKNVINNEKNDLKIKLLIPDEIINIMKNVKLTKIVLISEQSSKILNYNLINNYINSSEEIKNEFLNNNKQELIQIYKTLNDIKPAYFELINDYNECNQYIKENRKIFILYKERFQDIYHVPNNINIYYFVNNGKSYIYFEEEKIIVQIIKDNDSENKDLYLLKNYIIDKYDLLNSFNLEVEKYKDLNNIIDNEIYNFNFIKEFYLINNDSLKEEIKNNNNDYYEKILSIKQYPGQFQERYLLKFQLILDYLKKKNMNILSNIYLPKIQIYI